MAGLAFLNAGLGRSRSAAHSLMAALCAAGVAAIVFFAVGFSFEGALDTAAWSAVAGRMNWNWLGSAPLFLTRLSTADLLIALMGIESVALAVLIPIGAGGERWRLASICASTAVFAALTFPVYAHWGWGGGWLTSLGYIDTGGSGTIHVTGGLTAIVVVWRLGSRRGKYSNEGMPLAIPGHSVAFVLFGCLLVLPGWIGLNLAGAVLFGRVAVDGLPVVALNVLLSAGAAALVAAVITRVRYGRPDASLTANGWVGGLVAVSSGCAFLPPAAAVLIGMGAGALVTFSIELLELRLEVDDPGGSISVHAVAGIWGLLAAGMLGRFPGGSAMFGQVAGLATLLGAVLPFSWAVHALLDRLVPMRVSREGERQGMDLFELGAGAYPDFVTHSDDHMQR